MTQPRTRRDDDPRWSRPRRRRGSDRGRHLVKVMAWYDNKWGCTHQMIREAPGTTLGVSGG
jgi:glyceraldehyde-3-phosphate dehydrogenase/erythrose-4-phosphate dehydrogenase